MENGWPGGRKSCPTVPPDAVISSRFICSFQGKFYPDANVPFVDKRVLIHDIPESNEANRVHQIRSELLSSLSTKMKFFEVGSQHRTREEKSWVLACEGGNYGGQQEDTKMSLPFFVHTRITECSSPVSRDYSKEIATFESAVQAVSNNKDYKFQKTPAQQPQKQGKLCYELNEKRRNESALEDDHTGIGPRERDRYWERRKRNNASAKKSRDARKARELQTQIKAAFLEMENLRIHGQLMIAQQENACLKRVLCAKML